MDHRTLLLKPVLPFRLDFTAWALRRRPENIVDRWDGKSYQRVLVIEGKPALITVTQTGSPASIRLRVTVIGKSLGPGTKVSVKQAIKLLLGTGVDLAEFYKLATTDKRLNPLTQRFMGVKPIRFSTTFEALINGIACQQLSLAVGIQLLNRLAQTAGLAFEGANSVAYAFPRPEDLAGRTPQHLRRLGFTHHKAEAIIGLSRALVEQRLDLVELTTMDDREAIERLCELRGVGRWTAEYALLRGLGRLHIFPGDDIGARGALERWLRLRKPLDYERAHRILARWRSYAGFVYFHMLMNGLAESGYLD